MTPLDDLEDIRNASLAHVARARSR